MDIVGIYMIQCSKTKKAYIGSSIKINSRFTEHIRLLEKGSHHSYKLQNHWNSISKKNLKSKTQIYLELHILEECSREELPERELFYIELYDSVYNGFNINFDTRRPKKPRKKKQAKLTKEEYLLQYRYRDFR